MSKYYDRGNHRGGGMSAMIACTMIACIALVMASVSPASGQTCIPTTNKGLKVDGVLAFGLSPVTCPADTFQWGFIEAQNLTPAAAAPGQSGKLFITSYKREGSASIDSVYVGVQFTGDPQLTAADRLLLVFDGNGNGGAFDSRDFALVWNLGASTAGLAVMEGERCDADVGTVKLYRHNGTSWGAPTDLPAGVKMRTAWDYDAVADPENQIWEVETGINVATMQLSVAGSTFRVGARLIVAPPVGNPTIWRWPAAVDTDPNFTRIEPADIAGLSPGTLQATSFGNCCTCNSGSPRAAGFMGAAPFLMLAGGTVWLYRRTSRSSKRDRG